ncbi:type VII secretion integral membrane protein EccD [Haloactinospora alba]|uniref:Type VII secretion integral membrane protein EccD n=1 Tax=Haloactinospora alba TaxID=405555 RepID=A0A543NEC4_9ACTN|nr:type VII secretion integral membrane protein EccD [Haloactinospora alba]TQN30182.1 type VII secretion integral membrane protein EccD [Haloactinospora alba]
MTTWSRVTLVGERHKVDAVVPAEEPVGTLMPDVLRMLDEPVRNPATPLHLTTAAGDLLDGGATLSGRGVPDGATLRLTRGDDPLPAPVVHEVPEAVGTALDGAPGQWGPAAARWSAGAATGVLLVVLAAVVWGATGNAPGMVATAALGVLAVAFGAVLGGFWRAALGIALSVSGGAVLCLAVWFAADLYAWPEWGRWCGAALVAAAVVLLLGATSRLGRGGLVGGGVALLLAVLWTAASAAGLGFSGAAAVSVVACVVLLGLVLRLALTFSGLTVLDDRRSDGAEVASSDARAALADTHRGMVVSVTAVGVSAVATGVGLASDLTGWTAALAALFAVVLGSRSRMFPLTLEKAPLLAAALAVVAGLAVATADHAPWGVWAACGLLLGCLAVPLGVLAVDPPPHVRARLRRGADRVEAVAVVAIVPVAIGVFGTYQRLLATF